MEGIQNKGANTDIRQKLAAIRDIGAFMQNKELTQKQRDVWGKQLKEYASEILAHLENEIK